MFISIYADVGSCARIISTSYSATHILVYIAYAGSGKACG